MLEIEVKNDDGSVLEEIDDVKKNSFADSSMGVYV